MFKCVIAMMRSRRFKVAFALLAAALILTVTLIATQNPAPATLNYTSIPVLPAQLVWQKTYGGTGDDRAFYALDAGDGILVVGSSMSIVSNATVGLALKLDSDGNMVWNKTFFDGKGTELRYALNTTGGFLLVGNQFTASDNVNGYVARVDAQGNLIWQTVVGAEEIDKLFSATTTDGGYVVFGLSYSYGNGSSCAWAVKLDENGSVVWNKIYGQTYDTALRNGVLAQDGSILMAGYTDLLGQGNYSFYLIDIGSDGCLVWNKTYSGADSQKAYSMAKVADGYILAGDINSLSSATDACVIKVDLNGNLMWNTTIGGKNTDSAAYITSSKDGGHIVAGFTFSYGAGQRDFWLTKLSGDGQIVWSRTLGNEAFQEAYNVIEASEKQYVLVGWTDPSGHPDLIGEKQYDFYLVKVAAP
jgi:hypothetical protein